jgi:RNA polymerase sigma factor (sigma-70 family)
MVDHTDPRALFEAHRLWIQKVAEITCRRNSVWGDDAEDFAAVAAIKVIENDYAALRQFEGKAQLRTYLATIIVRRFYEWTRERWGRWRHSSRAEQLGETAKHLEALVYRDGYSFREAIEVLRSRGTLAESDAELGRMFALLPVRTPHHARTESARLDGIVSAHETDGPILNAERDERCRGVMEVLFRALSRLEPDDQILVRGRYGEGRSVADVARVLRCEQMPLYRRSERLRGEIRTFMEASGVRGEDVRECLGLEEP